MKRKPKLKEMSAPIRIALGVLIMALTMLILSFIGALIVNSTDNPLGYVSVGALAALLVSGVISAFIVSRLLSGDNSLITLLCSLVFSLILIAIALILSGGGATLRAILSSACYVAISLLTSRLAKKKGGRSRR